MDPEEFVEYADSEAVAVGWVVLGFVFDDRGRVLLIDQPWGDGWMAPGGAPKPGESLGEAVVREVREETGVPITPTRPHAVDEVTFVDKASGETCGWRTVAFEADATDTTIDTDLGLEDEVINEAAWFETLPCELFNPELAEPVYQRCVRGRESP